jgi:hypothetical protein
MEGKICAPGSHSGAKGARPLVRGAPLSRSCKDQPRRQPLINAWNPNGSYLGFGENTLILPVGIRNIKNLDAGTH